MKAWIGAAVVVVGMSMGACGDGGHKKPPETFVQADVGTPEQHRVPMLIKEYLLHYIRWGIREDAIRYLSEELIRCQTETAAIEIQRRIDVSRSAEYRVIPIPEELAAVETDLR